MPTLNIGGKKVTVGDEFMQLSPDQQNATVDEIAKSIGIAGQPVQAGGGAVEQSRPADIMGAIAKLYGDDQPKAPPPDVSTNPQNSALPGIFGQFANTLNAATSGAQDTATLNLGDEIMAVPFSLIDAMMGKGFDYGRTLNEMEQNTAQRQALNPQAAQVGSILGTAALMGKPGMIPAATITSAKLAGTKAAATAGGMGAAFGFGEPGTLDDRLKNAAVGGVSNALLGATLAKGTQWIAGKPAGAGVPTTQELLKQGGKAFKKARGTGAVISQPSVAVYADELKQMLAAEGLITPSGKVAGYPAVSHAVNLVDDFANGDLTISQALTLRKALVRAAKSTDPSERTIGQMMLGQLDDFMTALRPGNFVSGNGKEAVNAWFEGRRLWHVGKKAETVDSLISKAVRKSKKSVAVGLDDSLRNRFDAFMDKPSATRGFKPPELAQMQAVGDGTWWGNSWRALGGLAPSSPRGLMFKGGGPTVGGYIVGGPAGAAIGAALPAVGYVGKWLADLSTRHQAELASLIIRNGGAIPKTVNASLPSPVKKVLGNLIIAGGANSQKIADEVLALLGQRSQPQGRTGAPQALQ